MHISPFSQLQPQEENTNPILFLNPRGEMFTLLKHKGSKEAETNNWANCFRSSITRKLLLPTA